MSLTSKQIDELRAYAKDRKGELAKLITDAADTIEMLSAKLHASQMERSSQYYHGGWIPCSERLPEEDHWLGGSGKQFSDNVLISIVNRDDEDAWVQVSQTIDGTWALELPRYCKVVAWMPLPECYREGEGC